MNKRRIAIIVAAIIIAVIIAVIVYFWVRSSRNSNATSSTPNVVQTFETTQLNQTDRINPNTDIYIGTPKIFTVNGNAYYGTLTVELAPNDKPIGSRLQIHNSSAPPQNPQALFGNRIIISPINGVVLNNGSLPNPLIVRPTNTAILEKVATNTYTRLV